MSVDRTDYLVFGYDVGFENCNYEDFEKEIDGSKDRRFDVVYDGMCGEYAICGKIIATDNGYEGWGNTELDPAKLTVDKEALAKTLSEAFDQTITASDLKLMLVSNFS